jgi:hypothetical protein
VDLDLCIDKHIFVVPSLAGHHWTCKSWSSTARLDVTASPSTCGWMNCDPLEGAGNEVLCEENRHRRDETADTLAEFVGGTTILSAGNDQRKSWRHVPSSTRDTTPLRQCGGTGTYISLNCGAQKPTGGSFLCRKSTSCIGKVTIMVSLARLFFSKKCRLVCLLVCCRRPAWRSGTHVPPNNYWSEYLWGVHTTHCFFTVRRID